jgi:hypothetical protein
MGKCSVTKKERKSKLIFDTKTKKANSFRGYPFFNLTKKNCTLIHTFCQPCAEESGTGYNPCP